MSVVTDEQLVARVKAKCVVTDSNCWVYQGNRNALDYGQATFRNERWMVHRFMYSVLVGPIPDGKQACHSCDNPPCCNPAHIWLGSAKDNALDSKKKLRHYTSSKTHCVRGHAYAEHGVVRSDGRRKCTACEKGRWQRERGKTLSPPNRLKTHCIHGHELAGENLYVKPNGERQCKTCRLFVVRRIQSERAAFNGPEAHG